MKCEENGRNLCVNKVFHGLHCDCYQVTLRAGNQIITAEEDDKRKMISSHDLVTPPPLTQKEQALNGLLFRQSLSRNLGKLDLQSIIRSQENDPRISQIRQVLSSQDPPKKYKNFVLKDNLLYYQSY